MKTKILKAKKKSLFCFPSQIKKEMLAVQEHTPISTIYTKSHFYCKLPSRMWESTQIQAYIFGKCKCLYKRKGNLLEECPHLLMGFYQCIPQKKYIGIYTYIYFCPIWAIGLQFSVHLHVAYYAFARKRNFSSSWLLFSKIYQKKVKLKIKKIWNF